MLPGITTDVEAALAGAGLGSLPMLLAEARSNPQRARTAVERALGSGRAAQECMQVNHVPCVMQKGVNLHGCIWLCDVFRLQRQVF